MIIAPESDEKIIDQAIYLPLVIKVLERDRKVIEQSPFKLRKPYLDYIEETIIAVQKDMSVVKRHMHKHNIKVERLGAEDNFTNYMVIYKGYQERRNLFNGRMRTVVEEYMQHYLVERRKKE